MSTWEKCIATLIAIGLFGVIAFGIQRCSANERRCMELGGSMIDGNRCVFLAPAR